MPCPTPPQTRPDLNVTLAARQAEVRGVLRQVRTHLAGCHQGGDHVDRVELVLAEVLNNIIEHAFAGKPGGKITLSMAASDDMVRCSLSDAGAAMPGQTLPAPAIGPIAPNRPDSLPEGGFGWALIHQLTTGLIYARRDGKNHLSFAIAAPGDPMTPRPR